MAKVLIIGALAESLYKFRGDLIHSLFAAGHDVVTMAGYTDDVTRNRIEALGVSFRGYPVHRNGMNPLHDLVTLFALRRAFVEINPEVVLAYTIKPVIWGGLALRTLKTIGGSVRYYALITGLGLAFQPGDFKQNALTKLVSLLYRMALNGADKVIFQNQDNMQVFVDCRIVNERNCDVVSGSGVNISDFVVSDLPQLPIVFLTIARLLGDKGLREYVQAALIVKKRYPDVVFNVVGPADPSPDGIPFDEVEKWQLSGAINYLGSLEDVRPIIDGCHVYVLASYHEGMPRTVLEAMSMGRPILTTDVPGCRETVLSGDNGYLVPVKNVAALAERMIWFIEHHSELTGMGFKSRQISEARFDVNKINADMIRILGLQ